MIIFFQLVTDDFIYFGSDTVNNSEG